MTSRGGEGARARPRTEGGVSWGRRGHARGEDGFLWPAPEGDSCFLKYKKINRRAPGAAWGLAARQGGQRWCTKRMRAAAAAPLKHLPRFGLKIMASFGSFSLDVRGSLRTSSDDELFRDQVEKTLSSVGKMIREGEILWAGLMVVFKWSGSVKNISDLERMVNRLRVLGNRYMKSMMISIQFSLTETATEV